MAGSEILCILLSCLACYPVCCLRDRVPRPFPSAAARTLPPISWFYPFTNFL